MVVVVAASVLVVVGDGAVVTVVVMVVCDVVGAEVGDEVGASSWPVQAVSTASKPTRVLRIERQGIPIASMFENA